MIKAVPYVLGILLLLGILLTVNDMPQVSEENTVVKSQPTTPEPPLWKTPDVATIPSVEEGELVKYGKELIQFTSAYLGPKGTVMHISNGMNCQNCHLDAGTKPWGNNYFAVYSTYPKFRERSGAIETIPKRVNDCFERSLNGTALDTTGKEMRAIVAYIKWLGTGVTHGEKPAGSGIWELPFLDRAANPKNGALVYEQKCQSCHQADGAGILNAEKTAYSFPPLWGKNSYNNGAGLFRLSRFAGYVKNKYAFRCFTQYPSAYR